jgi:conjugal transfer mating pair stabilization protein TraN
MKSLWLVTVLMAGFIVNFQVTANDDFNSGMNYAKGLKGKDLDTFKSFKPADNLPDYSSSPDATKYYGGVQSSGTDLTSPGSNTLNSTEWGKAVTDSVSKQPEDMVTADSPFLDNGRNAEKNAETVFDPKLCESREFEKSVFTNYVCDRDLQVKQFCTRTATISGHYEDSTEIKQVVIQSQAIAFASSNGGYTGTWTSPVTGRVVTASATYSWNKHLAFSNPAWFMRVTTPFGLISMDDDTGNPALSSGAQLTEGAGMAFSIRNRNNKPAADSIWKNSNMRYSFPSR